MSHVSECHNCVMKPFRSFSSGVTCALFNDIMKAKNESSALIRNQTLYLQELTLEKTRVVFKSVR